MMSNKERIEVVQAYEDGEEIEFKFHNHPLNPNWMEIDCPSWVFSNCDYRVKPRQPEPARQFDTEIIPDPPTLVIDKLMKENESLKAKLKAKKKKKWEYSDDHDLDADQIHIYVSDGWILYKVGDATATYHFKRKVKK
jgi:hypothetical protein